MQVITLYLYAVCMLNGDAMALQGIFFLVSLKFHCKLCSNNIKGHVYDFSVSSNSAIVSNFDTV